MFNFTIDENKAIWGYAPEQEIACLHQPQHPDGHEWTDVAEATTWAEAWVAHMTDPTNNEFPA
jgi:hypothetical protein